MSSSSNICIFVIWLFHCTQDLLHKALDLACIMTSETMCSTENQLFLSYLNTSGVVVGKHGGGNALPPLLAKDGHQDSFKSSEELSRLVPNVSFCIR